MFLRAATGIGAGMLDSGWVDVVVLTTANGGGTLVGMRAFIMLLCFGIIFLHCSSFSAMLPWPVAPPSCPSAARLARPPCP